MKKIKYVYIVTGLILFGILLSATMSVSLAWKNGKHLVIGPEDPVSKYYMDYSADIKDNRLREYYGTHDWAAESALELLYKVRPGNVFLNRLRGDPITNNMLKMYFLYGTELPDVKVIPVRFTTECGWQFFLSDFHASMHNVMRFNDDGVMYNDLAARAADLMFKSIVEAFEKGDCQAAAAFLGAIMHVITDATFYPHVHKDIIRAMEYATHTTHTTYKKWSEGTRRLPVVTEFFSVQEAKDSITLLTWSSPYTATVIAARDTRFGFLPDNPNGFQTAVWMSTREAYWDSVNGAVGTTYARQLTWTYEMRPSGNNEITKYFNTVEHNLNTAIIYCAAAINFVLDNGGYDDCSCLGDWPVQGDGDNGQGVRDRTDIKTQVDVFTGLFFFNMAGLFATGIALAVLGQATILEKLIPI